MPYALRRRAWQWHVLSTLRQTLHTDAIQQRVAGWFRKYPNGLVPNVPKGHVPAQSQSLARSVATDVVSPPLSVRRSDRYEGARVPSYSRSHRTERMEHETVPVDPCIGRMGQPVLPTGCKRIRYAGVPATQPFATVKRVIPVALASGEGVVTGAGKILARLTSRQR